MNTCTKDWLTRHPRIREWIWFIVLWLGGLVSVLLIAYPIKWVIHNMGS